jgi:hypothetical protein
MKHLRWAVLLPFALFCVSHADTINAVHVIYSLGSAGGGYNASYVLHGPNIVLTGDSGAACASSFCEPGVFFSPGTLLTPNLYNVDFESSYGFVRVGGKIFYASGDYILFVSSITADASFRFPFGGNVPSTFTVSVPASFGVVTGDVNGTLFTVNIPRSKLALTFDYHPAKNGNPASYTFDHGAYLVAVPEPGALTLMATGLVGVVWRIRRRPR